VSVIIHEYAACFTRPDTLLAAHLAGEFVGTLNIQAAPDRLKSPAFICVEEFLHSYGQDRVVHTGRNVEPRQMKSGRGTRTGVLGVDHRDTADTELPKHNLSAYALLAGDQPGNRVPDRGGFDSVFCHVCRAKSGFYRFASEIFHAALKVL